MADRKKLDLIVGIDQPMAPEPYPPLPKEDAGWGLDLRNPGPWVTKDWGMDLRDDDSKAKDAKLKAIEQFKKAFRAKRLGESDVEPI